jgi:hypothetical protein
MEMTVFWDLAPRSLEEIDGSFRGNYCLHYQGDEIIVLKTERKLSKLMNKFFSVFQKAAFLDVSPPKFCIYLMSLPAS